MRKDMRTHHSGQRRGDGSHLLSEMLLEPHLIHDLFIVRLKLDFCLSNSVSP
jgi:hypothetical protein